jgi:hypothetical protein
MVLFACNCVSLLLFFAKDQLWRLLVASAVGPGPWAEEGADEGKLVKYGSRQFGGFQVRRPPRRLEQKITR